MGFKLIWESRHLRKLDKPQDVTIDDARTKSATLVEDSNDAEKTHQIMPLAGNSSSFGGFIYAFLKEFLLRSAAIPFLLGALFLGGFAGGYCYQSIVPQPDISANDINDDAKREAWRKKSDSWENGSIMSMLAGVVLTVTPTFLIGACSDDGCISSGDGFNTVLGQICSRAVFLYRSEIRSLPIERTGAAQ